MNSNHQLHTWTRPIWHASIVAGLLVVFCASVALGQSAPLPVVAPSVVGMNRQPLESIEELVADAIEQGQMPGCVIAVGYRGRLVWLRAYGHRQLEPHVELMTVNTVFDLASLTKPVATATSVMILSEQGRLRLDDAVSQHVPDFGANGKTEITIRQLLTHQSGLIPDNSLADYENGRGDALKRIHQLRLSYPPGSKFAYSDVGFIVLGELVEVLGGQDLHRFTQERIFAPLQMTDTGFHPPTELRRRCAATETRQGKWLKGQVHDPRAWRMGGVAGHAGLFSTAQDLARFAQMILDRGAAGDGNHQGAPARRVLRHESVTQMTTPVQVAGGWRAMGWDVNTRFSSNRGTGLSDSAVGHGGFTGTVMWIDPERDLFYIFLSNRHHPDGQGSVNQLAGKIGDLAVSALPGPPGDGDPGATMMRPVQSGLDCLVNDRFAPLRQQRVGLITNQTGVDGQGQWNVELFKRSPYVNLVALFSPEHGIRGQLDQSRIQDTRDLSSGLKVFSLYGQQRAPSQQQLEQIDCLVFDIQDIGTRFYTYVSTMALAMRAAARHGKRFVVLDRPNPIGGQLVAGPVLDSDRTSFVGIHPIPIRHGMTVGELALMFRDELQLDLDLEIVRMKHWSREQWFDETGLPWINPSPNIRSLQQATLYPAIGLLEMTNLSVGRGTETPFQLIGAPWMDGRLVAENLNQLQLEGVRFAATRFQPRSSKYAGQICQGVNVRVTQRDAWRPVQTGIKLALVLRRLYPNQWDAGPLLTLLGHAETHQAILDGDGPAAEDAAFGQELEAFLSRRAKFLIYP